MRFFGNFSHGVTCIAVFVTEAGIIMFRPTSIITAIITNRILAIRIFMNYIAANATTFIYMKVCVKIIVYVITVQISCIIAIITCCIILSIIYMRCSSGDQTIHAFRGAISVEIMRFCWNECEATAQYRRSEQSHSARKGKKSEPCKDCRNNGREGVSRSPSQETFLTFEK